MANLFGSLLGTIASGDSWNWHTRGCCLCLLTMGHASIPIKDGPSPPWHERYKREHLTSGTMKLPANVRHVRLLLAREKAHSEGTRDEGYDLLLPLDNEGRLDPHE